MLLSVVFTLLAFGLAFHVARLRRIHPAVVALVAGGVGSGAVIGSVPGAIVLIGLTVVASTGPSSGIPWAFWTTLAAVVTLAGITIGAGTAGLLARPHVNRVALRAASASAFAIVGVAISAAILTALGPDSSSSALLWSLPVLVVATSTLGFVLPRGR